MTDGSTWFCQNPSLGHAGGLSNVVLAAWVANGNTIADADPVVVAPNPNAIGYEGTPPDSIGSDGMYAVDEADKLIWGPKISGTWVGTSRSFEGDTGMTGATGAKGDTGSTGATGSQGAAGAAGTSFTIGNGAGGRPGSPVANSVYLNTATANFEVYDGTTWNVSFSAATGAQGVLAASAVQPSGIATAISANLTAVKTALGLI